MAEHPYPSDTFDAILSYASCLLKQRGEELNMTNAAQNAQLVLKKDERRIPVELCRIDRSQLLLEARGDAETIMEVLGLQSELPAKLCLHVRHIGQCGFTGTLHASGCYIVADIDSRDPAFERFLSELNSLAGDLRTPFLMDTLNPTIACAQMKTVSRRLAA